MIRSVPNEIVDSKELAARMGVSVRTVSRLRAEGMPHITWGRRMLRFDPQEAMSWAMQKGSNEAE